MLVPKRPSGAAGASNFLRVPVCAPNDAYRKGGARSVHFTGSSDQRAGTEEGRGRTRLTHCAAFCFVGVHLRAVSELPCAEILGDLTHSALDEITA
jgi:hypothetical protein